LKRVLPAAVHIQAAALEELGSRDAQLSAQKAALEERGAELEAWASQVGFGCLGTAGRVSKGRQSKGPQRVDGGWEEAAAQLTQFEKRGAQLEAWAAQVSRGYRV
jgi:hypothetical protein